MAVISSFGPPRLGGWAAAILLASATTAFADCGDLVQRFNQALEQRSLAEVTALEKQIAADAACGNRLVEVRQRRATLQLLLAQQLVDKGGKIPDYDLGWRPRCSATCVLPSVHSLMRRAPTTAPSKS